MAKKLQRIHGEPGFTLHSDLVKLAVTKRGGHAGPVHFNVGERWVAPYSLPPWKPKDCAKKTPPVLEILRGDFFCLPFGDNGDGGHVHGEPANRKWRLIETEAECLRLNLKLKKTGGKRGKNAGSGEGEILKTIRLGTGERAVYQEHIVSGLQGRFNYGHHAILQFPEEGGPYFINVSPFRFGATKPEPFTDPAIGEYSSLKVDARFRSLARVPLATGENTDLREVPARPGFEDLAMVSSRPGDFAWTAATLDGYVWISLKDPRILPSTLFWFTNGGRHYPPWNGKHRNRLGLEEVNSHFNDGLATSRKDLLKGRRIPTTRLFSNKKPTRIALIQLVHPVPSDFGMVARVRRDRSGKCIRISNAAGKTVEAPVNWKFLYEQTDG